MWPRGVIQTAEEIDLSVLALNILAPSLPWEKGANSGPMAVKTSYEYRYILYTDTGFGFYVCDPTKPFHAPRVQFVWVVNYESNISNMAAKHELIKRFKALVRMCAAGYRTLSPKPIGWSIMQFVWNYGIVFL